MVILFWVHACHMPKQMELSVLNKVELETVGQPVVCWTITLVVCLVHGIRRI